MKLRKGKIAQFQDNNSIHLVIIIMDFFFIHILKFVTKDSRLNLDIHLNKI